MLPMLPRRDEGDRIGHKTSCNRPLRMRTKNQDPATEVTQPPVDEKDPPPVIKGTASPAHDGDAVDVINDEGATGVDPSPAVDENAQLGTDQPP